MGNSGSKKPLEAKQENTAIKSNKKKSREPKTFVDRYANSKKKIDSGYEADIEDADSLDYYNQDVEFKTIKKQHSEQIDDINQSLYKQFSETSPTSQRELDKIEEEHAKQVEETSKRLFERFADKNSSSPDSDKGQSR